MKLYVIKKPASTISPRYTVVTYDNSINKITYVQRPKFFTIPPDHEIFQTSPNFEQLIPENLLEYNGVKYSPGTVQNININELKTSYEWSDHSTYAILFTGNMQEYKEPIHIESTTQYTRQTFKSLLEQENKYLSMALLIPYANGDDMAMFLAMADHEENVLITNGDIEVIEIPSVEPVPYQYVKKLVFPSISSNPPLIMSKDSTETFTINLRTWEGESITNRNATVYIEPIIGNVNKTRVDLINGIGNITVSSAGLNAGDIIRIKAGWKWWKGSHDIFITVTD
jgi:hypothetical protein